MYELTVWKGQSVTLSFYVTKTFVVKRLNHCSIFVPVLRECSLSLRITTTATYNCPHHRPSPHNASCLSASALLASVAETRSTTSTSYRAWYHHICKWSIYASGWRKEHHWHKLQPVTTTYVPNMLEGQDHQMHKVQRSVKPQVQGSKSGAAGPASVQVSRVGRRSNMQLQPPPTRSGAAQHNAAINATCVRAVWKLSALRKLHCHSWGQITDSNAP